MLYLYFTTLTSGLKIRMTLGGIDFHHMSSQSRLVPECLNAELAVMTLYLTVCQHVTISVSKHFERLGTLLTDMRLFHTVCQHVLL